METGRAPSAVCASALVKSKFARLTFPPVSRPKEYPCPSCHTAKRLRGSRAFANVTCDSCGAVWRPREEVAGWRLHELLARSGLGLIFHASHPAGGAPVAVKILALPAGWTPEDAARFTDEVQILAAHDHPHWLQIFAGRMEEDFAWLAMEWLPEGSLPARGRLGEMEALQVAAQIADALVAAHACGLEHRNLHIGECLLADATTVKVSGFAEASFYERAGLDVGTIWGRLCCVPPERLFDEPEDSRSEIYALGAIAFQMLTGEPPHEGETMPEIFMERLEGPPASVRDCVPAIRESTAALVDRMLAVDPQQRFPSWEETAKALGKQLGALSPAASPRRVVPAAVAAPVAKAPVYSATGGAWFTILMLAAIAGVAGWFGWKHFQEPTAEPAATEPKIVPIPTPASAPVRATPPPAAPAPVIARIEKPEAPPPPPPPPKLDWTPWKKFILESPKRPGIGRGGENKIPGSGALRLTGNNSGMAGGHDENVFYARQMEGDWTFTARVSSNDGPAGIVARESIGSDRPCVGLVIAGDGKLISVLREQPAASLKPAPVVVGMGSRWMRIARRGTSISAFHSANGKQWREAATLNFPALPTSVPVGFVVWPERNAKEAGATFENVALEAVR